MYYDIHIHTIINDIQYKQSEPTSKPLRVVHTLQQNTERGAQIMFTKGHGGGGTLTLPEATICMFIGPLKKKWSNSVVRTMAMDSDKFLAIESM